MTSHIKKWKAQNLLELQNLLKEYPVIGVASLDRFPAALSISLRKKLSEKAIIKASKTRIIKMALKASDKKSLEEHTKGSCALIFTKMNPFELFALLKKNKGNIPAKEGMIAEKDIIIPAGDTGLLPGPALSDLKQAGLKVKITGQSIEITEDKVVAKQGEAINKAAANALGKLDIKPIKIGINLVAVFESGIVYLRDILDVDTEQIFNDFVSAHRNAFNLAFNIAYPTSDTMPLLIGKAFKDSKAVALEGGIVCKATIDELLAKADRQAKAVKGFVKDAPAESQDAPKIVEENKESDNKTEDKKDGA